jgi:hypothetical protein
MAPLTGDEHWQWLLRQRQCLSRRLTVQSQKGIVTMTDTSIVANKPVQEPITGAEELGDLSQPTQVLAQFY